MKNAEKEKLVKAGMPASRKAWKPP